MKPLRTPVAPPDVPSLSRLEDLVGDVHNANRGTTRGRALLGDSLRDNGAGRSVVVDREGRIIAGNKTVDAATKLGMPIRVVASTGAELVVVQRTDLDLTRDARARTLALADNRVAELDLDWDPAMLTQHLADGVDLKDLWTGPELERLLTLGRTLNRNATQDRGDVTPTPQDQSVLTLARQSRPICRLSGVGRTHFYCFAYMLISQSKT